MNHKKYRITKHKNYRSINTFSGSRISNVTYTPLPEDDTDSNESLLLTRTVDFYSEADNVADGGYQSTKSTVSSNFHGAPDNGSDEDYRRTMSAGSSKSDGFAFENQEEETRWLSWIEEKLKKIAGSDGDNTEISLDQFKNALELKESFFAERFFQINDANHTGTTSIYNLIAPLVRITRGTPTQRLKFLFEIYDVDGNGTLDIDELKTVLQSCITESSVKLSDEDLENLTAVLFETADIDKKGAVTFEQFKQVLERHPDIIENLTISAAQWLKPEKKKKERKKATCCWRCNKTYIKNNCQKIVFFMFYILANLGLMGYAGYRYWSSNRFIIAARIFGFPLNFNCIIILLLILRKSITYLRMTFLTHILPLDDHIFFHKMVGIVIGIMSLGHTGAHMGNAVLFSRDNNVPFWRVVLTTIAPYGTVKGDAMITGWLLDVILIIIIICSMPFVRRSGHFEVFYWTHVLYLPFWILLILHGPNFWKWFVGPGVIFIIEQLSRTKRFKKARYGKIFIEEVHLLPSGVIHLEISRPGNFAYQPGDYIFVQIPVISKHEWHPFTISSAPELSDRVWIHVRSVGNWTKSLYKYFDQLDPGEQYDVEVTQSMTSSTSIYRNRRTSVMRTTIGLGSSLSRSKVGVLPSRTELVDAKEIAKKRRIALRNKIVRVRCHIDGPYGTATREIFTTEHAILIGAGIGVTPMASILQSIMYKYKASKLHCPQCNHEWLGEFTTGDMKLRKVDFVWINRDQRSFEWFVSLLTALEVEQSIDHGEYHDEKIIDMHMFMTAAIKRTDMNGIGLQIALDLMHERYEKDLITGLKVRTQPGRPDWNKMFQQIYNRRKGKIKVFFCGAPQLGNTIKAECLKFSFDFVKENF